MIKRFALALVTLAFGATAAAAAPPPAPMNAKVIAINKDTVQVVLEGKAADWMKKGGKVRFLGGRAYIVAIATDTLSITTPKSSQTKVGAAVKLEKPRAGVSGC